MWHHGNIKDNEEWDQIKALNPNFKGLVRIGAGYDNVNIDAAKRNNVVISNVPEYVLSQFVFRALFCSH